jgi:hypothetical protein
MAASVPRKLVIAKVEDAEFCLMLSITLAGVYPIEDH